MAPKPVAPTTYTPGAVRAPVQAPTSAPSVAPYIPPAPIAQTPAKVINPATGGVVNQNGDVLAGAKNNDVTIASNGAQSPAMPTVPQAPAEPDAVSQAEAAYKASLEMSPEELAANEDLANLAESYKKGFLNAQGQPIALDFITGQQESMENRALALAEPLQAKAARLEAKRLSSQNASKFALERADKAASANQPIEIGGNLVRKKADGSYESVYSAPAKPSEGFTLGEGQKRYDATGNLIASGPDKTVANEGIKIVKIDGTDYQMNADGSLTKPSVPDSAPTTEKVAKADDVIFKIDGLLNNANLSKAIGPVSSNVPNILRSGARNDVDAAIKQLIAGVAIENLALLKGPMSDKDVAFIKEASSGLNTNMSEEGFKAQLTALKNKFQEIKNKAQTASTPSGADDPLGLFSKPLSNVGKNGSINKIQIGNKPVSVNQAIATPLQQADAEFFKATGKHIIVNEALRSNERQAALYQKFKSGQGGRAAPPGQSFHETGKAIDVGNWEEAAPYLKKYGFKNNLADDRNHFSIGEFA
jgi:LAS superfamily LD-carboxypeptidase LdcB